MQLPQAFKDSINNQLGPESNAFFDSLAIPSPISIRANSRKWKNPEGTRVPWSEYGYYLASRPSFTLDPLFHAGCYYVQEASSMLLEQAVKQSIDLAKPIMALDLCAAPGGKSTHLLSLISNQSLLVSNEVIRARAAILSENITKWGYGNSVVTNNDPADFEQL
ncbi:MAG: rRNA methyltransferase, partial [Cytophagales bacterium]